jgi:DNA-directed RNA polymerase specialized sigma24 family protein
MTSPDAPDFPALLERYERPLVRYAQSIVGDVDSARDVVQEVFIKLARGEMRDTRSAEGGTRNGEHGSGGENGSAPTFPRSELRVPSSDVPHLEAWLFTVTRNGALDHHRKQSRIIPMPIQDDRPCGEPSPAATLESRDGEASLLRLLDALPPNQREVIRLKFQNDLTYREIAEVTQLTVTNIGFLLHTGLKKLRALAAELPQDDLGLHFRNVLP